MFSKVNGTCIEGTLNMDLHICVCPAVSNTDVRFNDMDLHMCKTKVPIRLELDFTKS